MLGTSNVFAATTIESYSFSGNVPALGGRFQTFDYLEGISADYVRVNIRANNGDKYDLRLVYTSTFPSERKILAEKKELQQKEAIILFISFHRMDLAQVVVVNVLEFL